jgi:hypothetical protein
MFPKIRFYLSICLIALVFCCGCKTAHQKNKIQASRVWIEMQPNLPPAAAELFFAHATKYLGKKGFSLTSENPEVIVKYERLHSSTLEAVVWGYGSWNWQPWGRGTPQTYIGEEGFVSIFHKGQRLGGDFAHWPIHLQDYSSVQQLLDEFAWYVSEPVWKAFAPQKAPM